GRTTFGPSSRSLFRAKGGRPRMAIKAEGITRAAEARKKEQAQYWVFLDGEFKRYADAQLGLMTHALHYGTGVFEGIRGYWSSEKAQLYLLHGPVHYDRLRKSGSIMKMTLPHSTEELVKLTLELLRRNEYKQDTYVRPLLF